MEATLDGPVISRLSFVSAVELSPRTGPVDASDIKKNLYGDFSSISDTSQTESLESKERIHVCLRIRPFMQWEKESDYQDCVSVLDPTSVILKAPKNSNVFRLSEKNLGQLVQKFTFSQVFGPETTQEELFDGAVKQSVLDFLKGRSHLIFTYGVTNAGKTYTYQGTDEASGILPRSLDLLFNRIQSRLYPGMDLKPHRCREHRRLTKEEVREETLVKNSLLRLMKETDYQTSMHGNYSKTTDKSEDLTEPVDEVEQSYADEKKGTKFSVWVSFCEIYNECIYDLLLPVSADKKRKVLRLAQDVRGCSYVKDLQWIQVSNSKEAFKLMRLGLKHQSFASTKLNANSSRSHCIFNVKMLKIDSEVSRVMQVNELFLCDLAGSERCTRTHNEGDRLKESGNINTSLLILGKCINALKTSQQSKLQQHIPFRESKLTHYFQGFFSGKGKVCMIVNVSQSAAAYDETLNVLRFSAIAQKVMVLDSSRSPQGQPLDEMSAKAEPEIKTEDVCMPIKRATILWERTLEDVMEDEEELAKEGNIGDEVSSMVKNLYMKEGEGDITEETPSLAEEEESSVLIGKDEYQRLLNIIEDLKNKLIDERKDKLLMELKIREEVTKEFAQYCSEKDNDLKMFLSHNQDIMEENCEERMQIYKDLVKECMPLINGEKSAKELKTQSGNQEKAQGNEAEERADGMDLSCMVKTLQHNVTDIKQQAEMAYGAIAALEEPQTTIERLEKQLHELRAELSQTQEELSRKNAEMAMQENEVNQSLQVHQEATEPMALQNKRIHELSQAVEERDSEISRLHILISDLEAVVKASENTIATLKHEKEQEEPNKANCACSNEPTEEYVGNRRKRCVEKEEEEGPPAKQGPINSKDAIDTKTPEEIQPNTLKEKAEILALEKRNERLELQLVALRQELEKEKNDNERFSKKITSLTQELSSSEEKASGLSRELERQQASCEKIISELVALRATNKIQGEKIQTFLQETETSSQTIAEQKSKIKAVEVKIGHLSRLGSLCSRTEIDLASQKETTEVLEECHGEPIGQNSSFHCSIESIWEVSKEIIHASSQKSTLIEGLRQQVAQLQRRALDAEDEKSQLRLKLNETINQVDVSLMEKESLLKQLKDLHQENSLYAKKYIEQETRALGFLEQIKEKDGLLDEFRAKETKTTCLEQMLKDKQLAFLVMEKEMQDVKEKLNVSESQVRKLNDQEMELKAEVLELRSKLRTTDLQEKDMEKSKETIERLNIKLSESTALVSDLQTKLQQKEEEYADLKEKLADAKKQIEQVQREVSSMRAEEKLLRAKVNELEKAKNQLNEELDVKQRTIQHFKKEDLNKKLENVLEQYEIARKDLCSKEKIIEDMKMTLEEQEQTQVEQDQVLEARLQQNERYVAELEEWKKKCHELEKQSSNWRQGNVDAECGKSTELLNKELTKLQEKLKECEEQHKSDRKKWLEEKMLLISQAKEAEMHRNREVKKFAENRELHTKQLEGAEKRLIEKDNYLQKWRTERDQLVTALEAQLNSLISSNAQKDKQIEQLKEAVLKAPGKDCEIILEEIMDGRTKEIQRTASENSVAVISHLQTEAEKNKMGDVSDCNQLKERPADLPNCSNAGNEDLLTIENIQPPDQSDTVLDPCEVSSESDRSSRFPKPEMEIQFTPLQPDKMEVKHQGSSSMVTIKVPKARKRKSSALDEDFLKSENERNAASPANLSASCDSLSVKKTALGSSARKDYSLRSKHSVSRTKSPGDTGGAFQKFGSLLQSSPTILQSKAKKFMATLKPSKANEEESVKEVKPKRARRKLLSTDISFPMDFSTQVIVMDHQKESDHEIIKRRLRTKKGH